MIRLFIVSKYIPLKTNENVTGCPVVETCIGWIQCKCDQNGREIKALEEWLQSVRNVRSLEALRRTKTHTVDLHGTGVGVRSNELEGVRKRFQTISERED